MKINRETKEELIEILSKNPILQPALDRCGISRATFFRWKNEDKKFKEAADKAIAEGRVLISELSESKLLSAIKNENLGAIKFWLQNNDPRYAQKLVMKGEVFVTKKVLSPEQENNIKRALMLSDINSSDGVKNE